MKEERELSLSLDCEFMLLSDELSLSELFSKLLVFKNSRIDILVAAPDSYRRELKFEIMEEL